jgi:hypothetical protein
MDARARARVLHESNVFRLSQVMKAACKPPVSFNRSCVLLDGSLDALNERVEAFDG